MARELPSIIEGAPIKVVAVVMIHEEIVAEGTASSGKYAKVKASTNALAGLKDLAPFEFRMQFRCDCGEEGVEQGGMGVEDLAGSAI